MAMKFEHETATAGWSRSSANPTSFARGAAALGVALLLSLPLQSVLAAPSANSRIGWQMASSDAEVDKAFALAKQSGKPVFLYWGAVWCPPCNQVQATLFSRADFAERSRAFIPVYVDGDKPGAQKVAARFKVAGYPTMILFKGGEAADMKIGAGTPKAGLSKWLESHAA